jgi:hypothetical protein
MRRRARLLVTAAILGGAGIGVWALTALGTSTEGPLESVLGRLGAAVAGIEDRTVGRARAPGRRRLLAWLEPYRSDASRLRSPDRILLGAYDGAMPASLDGALQLEGALGVTFPLLHVYVAWGDAPEHRFPLETVTAIDRLGSIPIITWEPWLSTFESPRHPHLPLPEARDRHGLGRVAAGDYDFYIDAWGAAAARYGKPLFVRLAHEMNDAYRYPWGPQHNTKEEFIAAWQHVVRRVRAAGATNVLWVWSPHVAYEYWELYFPGAEYVDWVATGVLNFGPIAQWSQWWTFAEIFGRHYEALAALGKPVMIAELGSLAVGGDRAQWYDEAIRSLPRDYPAVRALVFFNVLGDQTVTYQKVDWTVSADSALVRVIADALGPLLNAPR